MKIKKNHKVIISIALSLWIFFMGMEVGKSSGDVTVAESIASTETTTAAAETTTVESTTQVLTTEAAGTTESTDTTSQEVVTDTTETTAVASADPSSYTTDQIVANLNEAMATLESTPDFTAHVIDDIQVTVVDCSIAMATSLVNSVVQMFVGETDNTYTFVDGVEQASGQSTTEFVIPSASAFNLDPAGIASASAVQDGDSVVYTVTLIEETATYDSPVAPYHQSTVGYLDLTDIGLPSTVSIDDATLNYHGSTMTITVDSQGRVTIFDVAFPMDGSGTASISVFSGSAEFEGSMDQTWTFTY
ncbi:MAG: hypothetical protein R3Y27_08360 [Clostridia bacterium]